MNNVAHVGHSNSKVHGAALEQLSNLNTNTRYLQQIHEEYITKLSSLFPPPLSVVFLTTSGSEANDLALRIAKTITGGNHNICLQHAYHGNTQACMDVSPYKFMGRGGSGLPPTTEVISLEAYLSEAFSVDRHSTHDLLAEGVSPGEHNCIQEFKHASARVQEKKRTLSAVIMEPILGCGGQVRLTAPILRAGLACARENRALLILDEVQCGFQRVLTHPWAFQEIIHTHDSTPQKEEKPCHESKDGHKNRNELEEDFLPDIVTLGKPIANGWAMGAVITTPAIAHAFANGVEYFSTFGGSSVACAVGSAVLDELHRLIPSAKTSADIFITGLEELRMEFSDVLNKILGTGLFLGLHVPSENGSCGHIEREKDATLSLERTPSFGHLANNFLSFFRKATDNHGDLEKKMESDNLAQPHTVKMDIEGRKFANLFVENFPSQKLDIERLFRPFVSQAPGNSDDQTGSTSAFGEFDVVKTGYVVENEAEWISFYCRENGVLISTDGPGNQVLKIKPPMALTPESVQTVLVALRKAFLFVRLIRFSGRFFKAD